MIDKRSHMLKVVVGIISNSLQQILVAKRPHGKHLAGYWEFPGGKIEDNESSLAALHRELLEEIGIEVINAVAVKQLTYDYPEKQVWFDVWRVETFKGNAYEREGQEIRWVSTQELPTLSFPPANQQILQWILCRQS